MTQSVCTQGVFRGLFIAALMLAASFCTTVNAAPLPGANSFAKVTLAEGLSNGVDFEIAGDGRIFILNRYGEVVIHKPDSGNTVVAATMDVFHESEAGLNGIALAPDFASSRRLYLFYSATDSKVNRLSSFVLQGDTIDLGSEKVILEIPMDRDGPSHDAGNLEFNTFGHLYIGTGDAAEHSPFAAVDEVIKNKSAEKSSANSNDLRGKILRIIPDPDGGYSIPPGNLFTDGDGRPEIYIMGARNPYKFEIDPKTNGLFWADIGPDANSASAEGPEGQDEINLSLAAGNYGWPYFIGDNGAYLVRGESRDPTAPVNDSRWNTGAAILPPAQPAWITQFHKSLMAGPVYRADDSISDPKKLPASFDQHFFYWDFNQSILWYVGFDAAGNIMREARLASSLINSGAMAGLIDVEVGPDGHLYLLEYGTGCCDMYTGNGKLHRLDYTGIEADAGDNLALGKAVVVSSVEGGTDQSTAEDLAGENAVDGDNETRWSSAFSDPQWIYVDLGDESLIERIRIHWEYSFAAAYDIQISADASNWTTIHSETAGDGGLDDIMAEAVKARYVRLYAHQRGTPWGVSIHELEVWAPAPANNLADASFIATHYQGSGTCSLCHNNLSDSAGNELSIVKAWSGSMMANAARDPYWRAKVAAELKRNPGLADEINDTCSRCHAPMANDTIKKAGGKPKLFDNGMLNQGSPHFDMAMDGVSCTVCHQIEDNGALGTLEGNSGRFSVRDYSQNGEASPDRPAYGQYADPMVASMKNTANFTPQLGEHISTSEMCATCHDLKTPFVDSQGHLASTSPETGFPEQMLFTEWKHSDFRAGGPREQTCQSCHMPRVDEVVRIASNPADSPRRAGFAQHNMTGANTHMLAILRDNRTELGITTTGLDAEILRTQEFLKTAATLEITRARIQDGELEATVRITNQSGHKLPGAYPSRRVFIHLTVSNADGAILFESGKPEADGRIAGNDEDVDSGTFEPHYEVITSTDQVQIYEPILSDSDGKITHTLLRAATYLKDNRLTPPGFVKANAPADIQVIGKASGDADFDQGGDIIRYRISVGEADNLTVTARLIYQPLAFGHLQDLFEDDDLAEVARFKTMFEQSTHRIETIATASRSSVNTAISSDEGDKTSVLEASGTQSGGGGGSLGPLGLLFPGIRLLAAGRRSAHG